MQKTGNYVVDKRTGDLVEELKEDQIWVGLEVEGKETEFRRVLRSRFKPKHLNELFKCNSYYLRDQFGNVLWPNDWMYSVLPSRKGEEWKYTIVAKDEYTPPDDGADPNYEGSTIIMLEDVPKECEAIDIRSWLLFGLSLDYESIENAKRELAIAEQKAAVIQKRASELPKMDMEGSKEQQMDMRKKLSQAVELQAKSIQDQLEKAKLKLRRQKHYLMTEPIELVKKDPVEAELCSWWAFFTSPRGTEISKAILEKTDWGTITLAKERPKPFVSLEEVPADLIDLECNMRTVRLKRVKHGQGTFLNATQSVLQDLVYQDEIVIKRAEKDKKRKKKHTIKGDSDDEEEVDEFHVSSVGSMYQGDWIEGKRQGKGKEYDNVGIYDGSFSQDNRRGHAKLVYGKGSTYIGEFGLETNSYDFGKLRGRKYRQSLINGEKYLQGVEHGNGAIYFPDGATYEGEMRNGRITGYGRYISSTGVVQEGEFRDGLLHGEGSQKERNGNFMEGTWHSGVLQGYGKWTVQKTTKNKLKRDKPTTTVEVYEGTFDEGRKSGKGQILYADGSVYSGFFQDNFRHGRGTFYYGELAESLDCRENQRCGGFVYEGSFVNGSTHARHRLEDRSGWYFMKSKYATKKGMPNGVKKEHARPALSFTTNGRQRTSHAMNLLSKLYEREKKMDSRRYRNLESRDERETRYLQDLEYRNLKLYYELLDECFEKWAHRKREDYQDAKLSPDELIEARHRRNEEMEKQRRKELMKQGRFGIVTKHQELDMFEKYLIRVTLVEREKYARSLS